MWGVDAETSPDKYGSNVNNKSSVTPEQALTDFLRRVRPQVSGVFDMRGEGGRSCVDHWRSLKW